ncbi:MAG: hypothetical protein QM736_17820, partial [Vicinamibacterales bacterium]
MRLGTWLGRAAGLLLLLCARDARAQLTAAETATATLLYIDGTQSFIAPDAQRTIENALAFHRRLFDYTPTERTTVLLTDFRCCSDLDRVSLLTLAI